MFTNREEFLQWKAKEERGTCTSYTKPKGGNSKGTGKYIVLYTFITSVNIDSVCYCLELYTCCRDGQSRENCRPKKKQNKKENIVDHGS